MNKKNNVKAEVVYKDKRMCQITANNKTNPKLMLKLHPDCSTGRTGIFKGQGGQHGRRSSQTSVTLPSSSKVSDPPDSSSTT